jgi:formiminotetrahydrofolate cyclodeaminase
LTLATFLAEVADRTPAPGGGAAAAAGCGLGAALAEMAARFAGLDEAAERAGSLRREALSLAAAGKPGLRGDALAGADLAAGAARAAARLVEINLAEAADDPRLGRARVAVARADG